jgi:mRNA interferase RelE/StbE
VKIEFKSSFARDLRRIRDKDISEKVQRLISVIEKSESLDSIPGVKKLQSKGDYYRIRLGDFRVGVSVVDDTLIFFRILHRKDIYRYFP